MRLMGFNTSDVLGDVRGDAGEKGDVVVRRWRGLRGGGTDEEECVRIKLR